MLLGWTQRISDTRYFMTLEEDLEDIIPDKIAELDYRLYAKTCQWNKDHQQPYVRTFDGNLDDLKIQLRTTMKFNIPTYDDWLAERNLMEERACAEIKSIDLAKSSLLSILELTGEDIPALIRNDEQPPRRKESFKGADALIRKARKVREIVEKARNNIDVRDLIQQHNIASVCSVTKTLLEQQVFEFALKAKIRFPEVFEISPARTAERSASESSDGWRRNSMGRFPNRDGSAQLALVVGSLSRLKPAADVVLGNW
ncbi:hypothetical protein LTR06_011497 [Exophiala xenobiotica]|nr:hypothetical protein LTR06_011497 [Exophiala xenobiotica]